jgi:DNA-binding response OmpR family regulator
MVDTILVIEDDLTLLDTIGYNLTQEGYRVVKAGDGVRGLDAARAEKPDLVILDLQLPGLDGLSICRAIRHETSTPIMMLTARSGEVDRIVGLDSGADDYVVKPFSLGELLARTRALLRRGGTTPVTALVSDDLVLDLVSHKARRAGKEVLLAPKEYDLLAELMRHKGAVLSRDLLLERVWGFDFAGDTRTVDVHIRWLREKIETDAAVPTRIQTVRGIGYRFEG